MLLLCSVPAQAVEEASAGLAALDTRPVEQLLQELDQQYAAYLDGFSLSQTWRQAQDNGDVAWWRQLSQLLPRLFWGQVQNNLRLLGQLLALSILSLLLSLLQDSFSGGQTAKLCSWVVGMLLLALALTAFSDCMAAARQAVDTISDLLLVLLPVLMPLLASLGGVSTVTLISPALLFCLNALMSLLRELVFPLIWGCALLRLCGQLAPEFNVSRLASLCKDAALGVLGIVTSLFVAFLSLSGLSAAGRDGLAVRAAKTASSAFIPVVGRTLADSLDSLLGTVLVLKGAIGVTGGVALLLICGLPALRILVQALLFRLAGGLAQPLGDENLAAALSGVGQSLTLLFAAVAVAGLFAYFALALTVALGNVTMMLR